MTATEAIPRAVAAALAVAFCAQTISIVRNVLHTEHTMTALAQTVQLRVPRSAVDVHAVQSAGLFGTAESQGGALPALELESSLSLRGVIASRDPRTGYAILQDEGRPQYFLASGGALGDGSRLIEVYRDRVVLLAQGRQRILRLKTRAATVLPQSVVSTGTQIAADETRAVAALANSPREEVSDHFRLIGPNNSVPVAPGEKPTLLYNFSGT